MSTIIKAIAIALVLSGCNTVERPPIVWNEEMERHLGPQMDMEDAVADGVMDAMIMGGNW